MHIGFYLLMGVIGISPALLMIGGPIVDGLLSAYAAATVLFIGLSMRSGEAGYLARIIRPILISAIIPAVWMLIQIIPLPMTTIVHPIWVSAKAALNNTVLGSISVDRGATLLSFINYCIAGSVIFVSAAVTIDRSRADYLLSWLAAITAFAAIILTGLELDIAKTFVQSANIVPTGSLITLAALGVIINAAATVRAIERYETRRFSQGASLSKLIWTLACSLVGLAICALSIFFLAPAPIVFATVCGLVTFSVVMTIRRLGLGPWVNIVIAATAIVICLAIIASNWEAGDITLRFASYSTQATIQAVQSMLSDTRWMGNGAGTFGSLVPIYQDIDHSIGGPYAPTSAATIAIELGRPALYLIFLIVIVLLIQLLRGALQRGRDSFYPTAGASCIVLLMLETFCDAALLEKTTTIVACAITGLAFAQSISRTNQTG